MSSIKKLFYVSLFIPLAIGMSPSICEGQTWNWLWAKGFVCADDDYPVAVDRQGNIYKTVFSPCSIDTVYGIGPTIFKVNPSGKGLKALNASYYNYFTPALCTDKNSNLFLTGTFGPGIGFGSLIINDPYHNDNVFLVKFDSSGSPLWLTSGELNSAVSYAYPSWVSTDAGGNIFLSGFVYDTVIFGTDTLTSVKNRNNFYNSFLVKYDAAGNIKWARQAVQSGPNSLNGSVAVVTDPWGNSIMTGNYEDTISFGSAKLCYGKSVAGYGVYMVKYDSTGKQIWAKTSKVLAPLNWWQSYAQVVTAASDKSGNFYLGGRYSDTVVFGSIPLYSHNIQGFLVKFDSSGNTLWAKSFNNSPTIYSVATDNWNNVYVAGNMLDTLIIDGDTLIEKKGYDHTFIIKFDSAGTIICYTVASTGGDDNCALATDPSSHSVYFSGDVSGDTAWFGKDTIIENGFGEYPFLARWSCQGLEDVPQISSISSLISVFPNPSNGVFTFEIKNEELRVKNIDIYNVLGEKVFFRFSSAAADNSQFSINLSGQPNGIYFYRVISENGGLVGEGKLIIAR